MKPVNTRTRGRGSLYSCRDGPPCQLMHIGKSCVRAFFFAAPVRRVGQMKKWIAIWLTAMIGLTVVALAQGDYHPGTIDSVNKQHISGDNPFNFYNGTWYGLNGGGVSYRIAKCGSFKLGQAVDFRVAGPILYIRWKRGGDRRCAILNPTDRQPSAQESPPPQ